MDAKFLGTILAAEIAVGILRETFGVPEKRDLPSSQQRHRECQQAPCVGLLHKEQRSEHHGVVPVIDATGAATLVFQKPSLEGTEKEDANHVAHRIGQTKQNHNAVVENANHV